MGPKGYNTFRCIISDRLFQLLMNEYRMPDKYYCNNEYTRKSLGLDEYSTIEEIKQLPFLEYAGEHIHRIYNQEESAEVYVYCSAKDVSIVSKKLKEYLLNTEEQALKLDKKHLEELQKLELLSSISSKYQDDFLLMPWDW